MIQRIQTVWLFLAAICSALTYKFPFYTGNTKAADNTSTFEKMIASSNFLLLIFTAGLIAGSVAIIFLYKNRRQQLWLTLAATGLSIINLIIYFSQIKKFESGSISITAILALAIPVLLLIAARGIWKDEKLVKSLDRLR